MTRDTLAIPVTGVDVKHAFSLSDRIVIIIWSQLSSDIIHDIMMYKNHLSRRKEELNFFGNSVMSLREESMELELNLEEVKVLSEWRAEWWNNKKKQRWTW